MVSSTSDRKVSLGLWMITAFVVSLLISLPVRAQVTGATLSGTAKDTSGAVIPRAQISIKNVATGTIVVDTANSDGFYAEPNLPAGTYEVSASATGFATEVQAGVILTVGAQQVLNFTMQVGQVSQKIEVSATAPNVELASSSIDATVTPHTVVELPLNGRDWTALATLQPGVVSLTTEPSISNISSPRGHTGFGQQLTIAGTRPQLNAYRLDGISVVDQANSSPGSVLGVTLGVDAIAEFSVLTSNASAEYGRTAGGVVNAVTKSGTNGFHGDVYDFLRNDDLDARGFFDKSKIQFRRNQFGGSGGGPIRKNKTFFFADYEGTRQYDGVTNVSTVLSQTARQGILYNANGTFSTVTVSPLVTPFFAFWPLPNAGLIAPGNTGHYDYVGANPGDEDFGTARIDQTFSQSDSLSGTYRYDHGTFEQPDPLGNINYGNRNRENTIVLAENHTFNSTTVNSIRIGYHRSATASQQALEALNPLAASKDASISSFPGQQWAPEITVSGTTQFVGGLNAISAPVHTWNSYQIDDDVYLTKGEHSIKLGFSAERDLDNSYSPAGPNGQFNFGSITAFLTDGTVNWQDTYFPSVTPMYLRQSIFGGYIQDDWRFRHNLTINLGLRYEMSTVPTEKNNKFVNLPSLTATVANLGSPFFKNPTYRDFEPRVGLSWDPFGDGKTAVRAAFGIFDILPLTYNFFLNLGHPYPKTISPVESNLPAGSFPSVVTAPAPNWPSTVQSTNLTPFNPPENYLMLWNLNIQRQIMPSTTVMVGYVGNRGIHMYEHDDDADVVLPTLTPQGYLWPAVRGSGTRLNTSVGDITYADYNGHSYYDALNVAVIKKLSRGLQVQGTYTWQKGIDTGSTSVNGNTFSNSIRGLPWFCTACKRGLSDFNVGRVLKINFIYDLPSPTLGGAFVSRVLGGWELGGIITVQDGVPITPIMGGDPLGENNAYPYDVPNRLTGPGCATAVNPGNVANYINLNCFADPNPLTLMGNAARNSIIGPGLFTWDASFYKNNYIKKISESFNAQFRVEIFNAFNRPNFGTPDDTNQLFNQSGAPVAGAGSLDTLATTARQIQLALKLIW